MCLSEMPRKIQLYSCAKHKVYFMTEEKLNEHMKREHYELNCDICHKKLSNAVALRLHHKKEHQSKI